MRKFISKNYIFVAILAMSALFATVLFCDTFEQPRVSHVDTEQDHTHHESIPLSVASPQISHGEEVNIAADFFSVSSIILLSSANFAVTSAIVFLSYLLLIRKLCNFLLLQFRRGILNSKKYQLAI